MKSASCVICDLNIFYCSRETEILFLIETSQSSRYCLAKDSSKPLTICIITQGKCHWAIPEKSKQGRLGTYFSEKVPGIFRLVTLPSEIPDEIKLHPWKFCKILLHPLDILSSKPNTPGNSTLFFLGHLKKFQFFFNWPLECPHATSSIHFQIPCPQPSLFGFFWNNPLLMAYAGIFDWMQLMFTTWKGNKPPTCR